MNRPDLRLPCASLRFLFGCRTADSVPRSGAPPEVAVSPASTTDGGSLSAATSSVTIAQAWRGRVVLALVPGGDVPRYAHRVIRDQTAYEAFIQTLPTHLISMKQPAPPSDDALLSRPAVDWNTKMMLVAIRDDSMYVGPEITGVTVEGTGRTVTVVFPPIGDSEFAAAQAGIGTYHAVLVDRFDGTVRFSEPR